MHQRVLWRITAILSAFAFVILTHARGIQELSQYDFPPGWHNYYQAGEWIRENTEEDAVICARKPHWLAIVAHREIRVFPFGSKEKIWQDWEDRNVEYVVIESLGFPQTIQYLKAEVEGYEHGWDLVWRAKQPPQTVVLRRKKAGEDDDRESLDDDEAGSGVPEP